MHVGVPEGLAWWRAVPRGAAWLDELPWLVGECAARWNLTLGPPFEPATIAWVCEATLPDGTRAVLKVNFPEDESEHEADALAHWDGSGAVRLLRHDSSRRALLLERCDPGRQLWSIEDEVEAYAISSGVFRELWTPPPPSGAPFRRLEGEAARWAVELPIRWDRHGRPFSKRLLDEALSLCRELSETQPEAVLCHQDAHGGNILSAGERWLAIDPKPLIGERAFDLASALRDRRPMLMRSPDPARMLARRLDRFVAELGVDRERARGWGIVHALAWGVSDDTVYEDLVRCAEWLQAI